MTPRLAPARASDTGWLARILSDGRGLRTGHADRRALRDLIRQGAVITARGWVAPVGFLARSGDTIHALYVSPSARGRGIGERLIEHAKDGRDRLDLWTAQGNEGARRFYARHGFYVSGFSAGSANDEGAPDVRMTWVRDAA
ncbi:GNAT family N-acetyltransferase [Anianabacter salinae]|uniref:GNAT family N-acetyltransferase n=1 Tax=Anianabacter salinae TaxID=2851023 RepID=UPI00225E180A|nr:GNAT family N-acetyltransferase [Anianabacter salinae]MBV0911642.1 GNAT family N-acetyltransferase [Anianabacter salinae]